MVAGKVRHINVYGLGQFEFQIDGGGDDNDLNQQKKGCICGKFQLIGIPYMHVIVVALKHQVGLYMLCSPY